jgi:hypothetical protein
MEAPDKIQEFHDRLEIIHKQYYKSLKPSDKGKITMMRNAYVADMIKYFPLTSATILTTMMIKAFDFQGFLKDLNGEDK